MKKEKNLAKARNNPAGWSSDGLCKLLESWGFRLRVIGKEIRYEHAVFPDIKMSITKASGDISRGYVREAVSQIDAAENRLRAMKSDQPKQPKAPNPRTPKGNNPSKKHRK